METLGPTVVLDPRDTSLYNELQTLVPRSDASSIMKAGPTTLQQLSACCGLSEEKIVKWGESILRCVNAQTTTTTTTTTTPMDLDSFDHHQYNGNNSHHDTNNCDGGQCHDGTGKDNNEGGNVEECTDGGQGNNCGGGGQCDHDGGECFGIDDKVEGRWKKDGKWYSGTITGMKNKKGKTSYDVTFDSDGSWYVGLALLCNQYNDAN